jgi:hypothetical protein
MKRKKGLARRTRRFLELNSKYVLFLFVVTWRVVWRLSLTLWLRHGVILHTPKNLRALRVLRARPFFRFILTGNSA